MKKKDIEIFINKFSYKKNIGWIFDSEDVCGIFGNNIKNPASILIVNDDGCEYDAVIRLKDSFIRRKNNNEIKAILLHELGHLHSNNKRNNKSINESEAHLWAVKTCVKYRLFNIMNVLIMYWVSWAHEDWRTNRIYRLAYKDFKKRMKLPKRITKLLEEFEKEKL